MMTRLRTIADINVFIRVPPHQEAVVGWRRPPAISPSRRRPSIHTSGLFLKVIRVELRNLYWPESDPDLVLDHQAGQPFAINEDDPFYGTCELNLVSGKTLDHLGTERRRISCRKFSACVGQFSESSSETRRIAMTLEAVVSPTRAILVHRLDAAGQEFRSIRLTKTAGCS